MSETAGSNICSITAIQGSTATLTLEKLDSARVTAKLTTLTQHIHLYDAPYDMFCMPYSDDVTIKTAEGQFKSSKGLALATMNAIAAKYVGVGALYDIQLLPYCPIRQYILGEKHLDLTQNSSSLTDYYYYITDSTGASNLGVFMYCSQSSNSFDIPYSIQVKEKKIENQCDMYRLCSPNYASIFEFNAARNDGVSKFNVDFAYKPYNPYIHLNPNFNLLYGIDNNSPRGLVCGGDFSISIVSDQFATYELQNKNYQLSFQRQIENMNVNNAVQKEQEIWQLIAGGSQAGVLGAGVGNMLGGVGGAIAGVGAGLVSAAAGLRDIQLNNKLRSEALDYTKDQFGYQLGNIQALPNTISKVTAFNPNNQIFPVLEYYTCTPEEKEALRNKIKYNSMTVMRIGKIADFIKLYKTYIKGKLIRLEDIGEDYHILAAIAEEIYKGVFI